MSQQPPVFDPRQPLGRSSVPAVSVSDYATRPDRRPLWIALGVLVVVLAVLVAMFRLAGSNPGAPADTPSPSPEPATASSATPRAVPDPPASVAPTRSVPFENARDDARGTFEIVSSEWTSNGVTLKVRISIEEGSQKLGFFCLDNESQRSFDPVSSGDADLQGRNVEQGQSVEGTVSFDKTKGPTTVFLTDSRGRQIAALVVTT